MRCRSPGDGDIFCPEQTFERDAMKYKTSRHKIALSASLALVSIGLTAASPAQELANPPSEQTNPASPAPLQSTQDYNQRLEKLREQFAQQAREKSGDYRIGPQDLLEINIFEAPELNRTLRVSESGEVSLPLLGAIQVAALTARELESALAQRLREFLKDPHVNVMVTAI